MLKLSSILFILRKYILQCFWYFYQSMKQRIYIDTSVIGGYYDTEFEVPTKQLFERIVNKDFIVYFSRVNETELEFAHEHIKAVKFNSH